MINRELLRCAKSAVHAHRQGTYVVKGAAVPAPPPGADPSMGGAPPGMDPSMGGAPPGGTPPGMDPSMGGAPPGPPPMDPSMGGAPPMDPSMGGAPPGGAPPGGDLLSTLQPIIDAAVQKAVAAQGGGAGAGGAAGAGAGGAAGAMKVKPEQIYIESVRQRKLMMLLLNHFNISLPPDILNDPAMTQDAAVGMPPGGGASAPAGDASGGAPGAVPPIEPVQPAFGADAPPGGGAPPPGDPGKSAAHSLGRSIALQAAALLAVADSARRGPSRR